MAVYLVLRILRDAGRGYRPEPHEGEIREGGV